MGLVAALDRRFITLSRNDLIPPHQSCRGEEATLVGAVAAMEDRDWVFWGRQLNVAALWRGLSVPDLLSHAHSDSAAAAIAALNISACSQGPASRLSHAAGLAWAARHDGVVALCELGDGAVSDADFHCGVNFAAVLGAPVVFLVRSAGVTAVAARAEGYGIDAVVVEGKDPERVRATVARAADKARAGGGPTLIEATVDRKAKVPLELWTAFEADISAALASAERRL